MSKVGRYVKATAKSGQGDALAERLLEVADALRAVPACELYLINRSPEEPDAVWVTEVWSSQEELDAALAATDQEQIQAVLALSEGEWERTDLTPVGGVGARPAPSPGYTRRNLGEAEDQAVKFGYGEMGEARFVADDLDAELTGISLQSLRPGKRQMFAHRHHRAEEVYVVLAGSGRLRIGDDVIDVGPRDAIRVAPDQTRAFEAGPEGLEILATGARWRGDAEIVRDWWTD
jgi:quinol monooxygenase YgiN/mannose-6-phosphate isomerase-like protein (cupin superfamily)